MTLRHLTIFLCVCDEGTMTAAAGKLYMAQPSVSQAVAELEKHYQVKLFERLGRKLYLTTAGQKLLTYARHIINLSKEAEREMKELQNNGLLRVGATVTVGTCILSDIIKKFLADNSNVKIIPTVDNTRVIQGMLLVDQADIGLVEGTIHSRDLIVKPFMEDELVLICNPTHLWAQKGFVGAGELNDQEFIVREEGSGTRELFESVMALNGINWHLAGVLNNAETIKNSVAAGLGMSVISRIAVQKEVDRNELVIVKINGITFKRQFSLVYHKNKFISPVLQRFIEEVLLEPVD